LYRKTIFNLELYSGDSISLGYCDCTVPTPFVCKSGHNLELIPSNQLADGKVDTCQDCETTKLRQKAAYFMYCETCQTSLCQTCTAKDCKDTKEANFPYSITLTESQLHIGKVIGVMLYPERKLDFYVDGVLTKSVAVLEFSELHPYGFLAVRAGMRWNFGQNESHPFKFSPINRKFESFNGNSNVATDFSWQIFDEALRVWRDISLEFDMIVTSETKLQIEKEKLFYNNKRQVARGLYGAIQWANKPQRDKILQCKCHIPFLNHRLFIITYIIKSDWLSFNSRYIDVRK
jgi:hypothetical protein